MVKVTGATLSSSQDPGITKDAMAALKVGQTKRNAMERRDLDTQVDRELKERFAEWTFVDTGVRMQDGQSMRQEFRHHKYVAVAEKKDCRECSGTISEPDGAVSTRQPSS